MESSRHTHQQREVPCIYSRPVVRVGIVEPVDGRGSGKSAAVYTEGERCICIGEMCMDSIDISSWLNYHGLSIYEPQFREKDTKSVGTLKKVTITDDALDEVEVMVPMLKRIPVKNDAEKKTIFWGMGKGSALQFLFGLQLLLTSQLASGSKCADFMCKRNEVKILDKEGICPIDCQCKPGFMSLPNLDGYVPCKKCTPPHVILINCTLDEETQCGPCEKILSGVQLS